VKDVIESVSLILTLLHHSNIILIIENKPDKNEGAKERMSRIRSSGELTESDSNSLNLRPNN